MQKHDLIQGSPEWLAHRMNHLNASDAPAMMGESSYKTRTELIREIATGLAAEVSAETEALFASGHRFEALARPLAEEILGEELYPVTGSNGKLSASFDGLDMLDVTNWEHKRLNKRLRAALLIPGSTGADLPLEYQIQCEQQHMVSGAERTLFMASDWDANDNLKEEMHCWYTPNPALAAKIAAGWEQFEADVAAYVPTETSLAPVAAAVTALPAVSVQVSGSIVVRDNFKAFEVAARDFIENKLIRKPESDQDFADLSLQIKALEKAEEALGAAEAQMLSQVDAVDAAKRTKDMLLKLVRDNRLMAEKLLASRKEQIKVEQVQRGQAALTEHVATLNKRIGKPYMPAIVADFAGAIKGKRTVESLKGAVDDLLATKKIEASAAADRIQINLATLTELASDHKFLFADAGQIVLKAADDLTMLVKSRISEHQAAEQKRADELAEKAREKIRAEEAEKLAAEAARKEREEAAAKAAEAAKLQREQEEFDRQREVARQRHQAELEARTRTDISFGGFDPKFCPGSNPENPQEPDDTEPAPYRASMEDAMSEIHGIQQQVIIATMGRLGVRVGGTIECIRDTLAETEALTIGEHLGILKGAAQKEKDKAVAVIRELLALAEAKPVKTIHPAAAALRNEQPTLTLGAMKDRLGFTLTADFLAELGFEATPVKAARLYRESQFGDICAALVQYIESVRAEVALAA